jgi:holo-[acyl-carrier protein] synthase
MFFFNAPRKIPREVCLAKEAFAKALGNGIGKKIGFQSIAILNYAQGAPVCYFFGDLAQEMCDRKLSAKVSIADEIHYAVAQVLILEN